MGWGHRSNARSREGRIKDQEAEKRADAALVDVLTQKHAKATIDERAALVERDAMLDMLQEAMAFIRSAADHPCMCHMADGKFQRLTRRLKRLRTGPLGPRF